MTDLFSVKDKVALVTGGARGIGLMIARGYVGAGATVYISSRKKDVCDQVAAELSRDGTCIVAPGRLSAREAGATALAKALAAREPALARPGEQRRRQLGRAAGRVSRLRLGQGARAEREGDLPPDARLPAAAQKAARPGDPARVINIGSIDGLQVPLLETYAYSPSKAAVHHLTRVARAAPRARHITVNAVAPGPVREQDDARDARALPRRDRAARARSAGSASPRTWRAWRSTSRRARARTSPAR